MFSKEPPARSFNGLGKCGAIISEIRTYQLAQKPRYIDETSGLIAQLNNEPDVQAVVGSSWYNDLFGPENAAQTAVNVAQRFLDRIVFLDNPQPNQSLVSTNVPASVAEVIRQMLVQGVTIQQLTVTITPGAFSNVFYPVGNEVIVTSVKRPSDGRVLEHTISETMQITCTNDSVLGGATAYNETFTITGEAVQGDVFAWNWPLGSGASITFNAIDGDTSNGSGNLLTNSGFASWVNTANVPDNWTLSAGTAGTNIAEETGLTYSGTAALKIIGDGTTQTALVQTFSSSNGSSSTLSQITQYSHNIFLRRSGAAITQGVLRIALVDGNGVIVNDQNGVPNSYTIDLTTLSTTYTAFNGVFRTPALMPSAISLQMCLTTALNSGGVVYAGKSSLGEMAQLYTSGPYVAIHSGNQIARLNDYTPMTVTNSYGAGGSLDSFQILMNRLFSLQSQDIIIPSSLTPSVSDSLISS